MRRWRHRPPGSNWGEYGDEDQLGRLNLVNQRKVLQGVAEVREGKSFCLSLPLDFPGKQALTRTRRPPMLFPANPDGRPRFNYVPSPGTSPDVECDDGIVMWMQYSTQWDALSHVGALYDADGDGKDEIVYYNGFRAGHDIRNYPPGTDQGGGDDGSGGAHALDVTAMASHGVQGRAVMIDLRLHFKDRVGPHAVGYEDLMAAMTATGATVETGDMVCLYTGFSDLLLSMNRDPNVDKLTAGTIALDGRDARLLDWITESGMSALISDNFGVELYPARTSTIDSPAALPLHHHCLFKLGMPLGELWQLNELALWLRHARRSKFLLTAPPLRLPRAVGSPVTPIGTV